MEHTVRRAGTADAHLLGQLLFDFNTEFEAPTPTASALAERFRSLLAGTDLVAFLAECAEGVEHPAVRTSGFALLSLRPTPYSEGPLAQLEELYVRPPSPRSGHRHGPPGCDVGACSFPRLARDAHRRR
jgi:hypothetical protein